jgi:hydroxypyruvate isomerase
MPRFAANLAYLFADRAPVDRFAAAAAAGFTAVELLFPYEMSAAAVRAELAHCGLTMLGINTPLGPNGEPGLAAVPGQERGFAVAFKQAIDYAVAIGARTVHCLAGCVDSADREAAEEVFVANLRLAAETAGRLGIGLLIEPLNPRDRPDYFLATAEQAADIVHKVGSPDLRIQFDFYHAQIAGGDLSRRFEAIAPLVGHVQIASVPERNEPDRGEVNYRAIFAMLDRLGYAGFVGCEYRPRGKAEDGLGWLAPYGIAPQHN